MTRDGPRPTFLCDEMLGRLARYLRAAGYDTLVATGGFSDSEWLRHARAEGRVFLTLDRRILEHKAARGVALLLPRGDLDDHARAVTQAFDLDWETRAFTRCLIDNTLLVPAGEAHRPRLPPDVTARGARHCPRCGRLYWAGSHHRRMRARLHAWQQLRGDAQAG